MDRTKSAFNWGVSTADALRYVLRNFPQPLQWSSGVQNTPCWTAGRQVITGVVLSTELEVNKKFRNVTLKGEVLPADGRKLWTSLPARAAWETL